MIQKPRYREYDCDVIPGELDDLPFQLGGRCDVIVGSLQLGVVQQLVHGQPTTLDWKETGLNWFEQG